MLSSNDRWLWLTHDFIITQSSYREQDCLISPPISLYTPYLDFSFWDISAFQALSYGCN